MSKIMEEVPPMPILDASTTRLEAPQSGNKQKRTVVRTAIIGAVAFTLGATLGVAGSGNAEELDSEGPTPLCFRAATNAAVH
jgi:hypothetical protein